MYCTRKELTKTKTHIQGSDSKARDERNRSILKSKTVSGFVNLNLFRLNLKLSIQCMFTKIAFQS